jgi:hypothetical protein
MPAIGVCGCAFGCTGAGWNLGAGMTGCGIGCATAIGPLKFGDGSSPTIEVCDWQPTIRRIEQTDAVIEVNRRKACDWPIPGLQDERTKRYDPASMPRRTPLLSEFAGKSSRSAEFAATNSIIF